MNIINLDDHRPSQVSFPQIVTQKNLDELYRRVEDDGRAVARISRSVSKKLKTIRLSQADA